MAGNTYGKLFRISSFGESHGKALGVIIDGCPAGLPLSEADIQPYMDRRKPGQNLRTTARKEADRIEILSGVFEGKTTGTSLAMVLYNEDQHSKDYSEIQEVFRPGHADFGFFEKYGFRDYRGGGRSSGRETAARVAAGAVAAKLLRELGVEVSAGVTELAGISTESEEGRKKAEERILEFRSELDSAGGVVTCTVRGLTPGIGEPVFDKLDARLAQGIMSIGAVKAVEFGDGVMAARSHGSENNDAFYMTEGEYPAKQTNHSGGVLGGMSDGAELLLRAYFKPTPSIARAQQTVNERGEEIEIEIKGRHDPTVVERAEVVVECMTAITVLDCMMENAVARLDRLKKLYE